MSIQVLIHLKHAHRLFAEDLEEFGVRVDLAPILRILKVVPFYVLPHLLHDLAARQTLCAYDLGEFA